MLCVVYECMKNDMNHKVNLNKSLSCVVVIFKSSKINKCSKVQNEKKTNHLQI